MLSWQAMKDISRGSPPQGRISSPTRRNYLLGASGQSGVGGPEPNMRKRGGDPSPSRMDTSPSHVMLMRASCSALYPTSGHGTGSSSVHAEISPMRSSRQHHLRARHSELSPTSPTSPLSPLDETWDMRKRQLRQSMGESTGVNAPSSKCTWQQSVNLGDTEDLDAWARDKLTGQREPRPTAMVAPLRQDAPKQHGHCGSLGSSGLNASQPRRELGHSGHTSASGVQSPRRRSFVPFPALSEEVTWNPRPDQQVRDYKARTLGCTSDADRIRALSEVLKTISPRYDDQQMSTMSTMNMGSSMEFGSQAKLGCMPQPPRSGGYLDRSAGVGSRNGHMLPVSNGHMLLAGCQT